MKARRPHDGLNVRLGFPVTLALVLSSLILPVVPAVAQEANVPPARSDSPRGVKITLKRSLERLSQQTGILVVSDSLLGYEQVPASASLESPAVPLASPEAEALMERQLRAVVKTLPPGTLWAKLYLPAPADGKTWRGDDVAAFAFAQARLFGKVGAPSDDGSIEILGKRVDKATAPQYVAGLGLKPVYLITNPNHPAANAVLPFSPMSQEQWSKLSDAERKQYGEQQAAWIMSLSPEMRERMFNEIRQHDKYFDTVKDPLEKMLGHDL